MAAIGYPTSQQPNSNAQTLRGIFLICSSGGLISRGTALSRQMMSIAQKKAPAKGRGFDPPQNC
jgi:hypothetical protein